MRNRSISSQGREGRVRLRGDEWGDDTADVHVHVRCVQYTTIHFLIYMGLS